ncbi:MAG: hypothetical protein SH817_12150 [Leptospira sp.]|nr:hypothetical protein [Leptospira sp.]
MYFGIYLQFSNGNKYNGEDQFRDILKKITGQVVPVIIVENNHQNKNLDERAILGNNSEREFSGYQTGLEYLKSEFNLDENTVLFFANDTFNVNYAGDQYLELFLLPEVISNIHKGNFVGYVDRLAEDVSLLGRKGNQWIRTSFFSISYGYLNRILPFGKGFASDHLFSNKDKEFFSDSNEISENYKEFLRSWLFGEKNKFPSEVKWHSAKNLTKANFSGFKIKAQCIFSEFLLSQDALLSDVKFVDVRNIKL